MKRIKITVKDLQQDAMNIAATTLRKDGYRLAAISTCRGYVEPDNFTGVWNEYKGKYGEGYTIDYHSYYGAGMLRQYWVK